MPLQLAPHVLGWTNGVEVEDEALAQLTRCASLPFVGPHVAAMPDVHFGRGSTVGSVIPTRGAIIPAAVGVDIGCGMTATRLSLNTSHLPDNLHALRTEIERVVPHGRTSNGGDGDRGSWHDLPDLVRTYWAASQDEDGPSLSSRLWPILDKHKGIQGRRNPAHHLGTLGTGNHFIEVCLDEAQQVWVMLHSGSRGIGNRIGTYFISKAKEEMERWHITPYLPDRDLSYLVENTSLFDDYVEAVSWAQDFAALNRRLMMQATIGALSRLIPVQFEVTDEAINCHHNYVSREHHFGQNLWITRKGAVRARQGDLGIIPGSMGVQSYIVRGLGNPASFHSCSHGAGRRMSRTKAKATISLQTHSDALAHVECNRDDRTLDETPSAYKSIDAVMAAQQDLVQVVHTLHQVLCVKG